MTLLHPSVQTQELYPIGSIIEATCPPNDNWIKCEGQLLSRSTYAELLAALDTDNPYAWQYTYTKRPLDSNFDSSGLYALAYSGSRWVAVGESGDSAYSDNGETWTYVALPNTGTYLCCAWNGTVFLTIAYNSTNSATSTNGSSWTGRTMPATSDWEGLVWDGTYFIPVANDDTQCRRSTDGINWSSAGTFPVGAHSIATNGSGITLAMRSNGHIMRTTDNGSNWTTVFYAPYPLGTDYGTPISYANGYFILPAEYRTGYTIISSDGLEWKKIWFTNWENIGGEIYSNFSPRELNLSGIKWYYFKDQWFALPDDSGQSVGVRSPDLKRFYPWVINMGGVSSPQIAGYNSSTGKIFIIESWYRYMTYCEEYIFNNSTYFQLPRISRNQFGVNNLYYFIRAK
jgi:hypothetical protein